MRLGLRIKRIASALGITVYRVAKVSGNNYRAVCRCVSGHSMDMRFGAVAAIAEGLGLPLDVFTDKGLASWLSERRTKRGTSCNPLPSKFARRA